MDRNKTEALKVLAALTARALEQRDRDGDCHDGDGPVKRSRRDLIGGDGVCENRSI